ncbi:hypothetical protein DPMN_099598 [Dreissena polymorpha]|uniref:Uncharacterized protein n=1 Tax=Dreissena polymorpha TaxID=45954 RepID=A0A9D4LF84_DREPO|nr:hypothetical protein DPMN_099598 [Dreissena polymorpha]
MIYPFPLVTSPLQDPSTLIHHESPMELAGAEVEQATDYIKRPHVFRLRLPTGAEFLFMAKDNVSTVESRSEKNGHNSCV